MCTYYFCPLKNLLSIYYVASTVLAWGGYSSEHVQLSFCSHETCIPVMLFPVD